jgi:methylase of polypeptide subunit release factors
MFEYSHKYIIAGDSVRGRTERRGARSHTRAMGILHYDSVALAALGHALQRAGYRFTTVTPATHQRVNARAENAWAHDLRGVFGWSRPFRDGVVAPALMNLMREAGILQAADGGWRSAVRASSLNGRLYFHSAYPATGDDAVFFGPDTCRFVAAIVRGLGALAAAPARIADIGCGAAPAAIELALRFPQAEVVASDVNESALAIAAVNARLAGAAHLEPCRSRLLDGLEGQFDLIVSNPPYVLDPDERTYRHGGGMHGAQLSVELVEAALGRLRPGGTLMLYTGVAMTGPDDPFMQAILPFLGARGARWSYEELDPDVFGEQLDQPDYHDVERIAAVWLVATVP